MVLKDYSDNEAVRSRSRAWYPHHPPPFKTSRAHVRVLEEVSTWDAAFLLPWRKAVGIPAAFPGTREVCPVCYTASRTNIAGVFK